MKHIEVVAAIIRDEEGCVFATQRGLGEWKDWWEFPGGKMEAGETPEEALKREKCQGDRQLTESTCPVTTFVQNT